MRWQDRKRSSNVEDRRGQQSSSNRTTGRSSSGGGFPFNIPSFGGGGGRGGMLSGIVVLLIALLLGGGGLLGDLFGGSGEVAIQDDGAIAIPTFQGGANLQDDYQIPIVGNELDIYNDDELVDFLSVVLAETEDTWAQIFKGYGRTYRPTTLVIYEGSTQSACGTGTSETGPFYCPADQKVYIDVSFFRELSAKYKAAGDFAIAYVLAHEVAHHVQYLLGVTEQVEKQRGRVSQVEMNRLTVRLELQADYLAGVWAHWADQDGLLTDGDLQEAMTATAAIGDDRLQKQASGRVVPDSFTHGTSRQRTNWFVKGYNSGSLDEWDTFGIPYDDLHLPLPFAVAAA